MHELRSRWSFLSVYTQQSQYSTQASGGIYDSSSMNLGVSMGSGGGSMNPMSAQMAEQVTPRSFQIITDASSSLVFIFSSFLFFYLLMQVSDGSLILEQLAGLDMMTQESDVDSVSKTLFSNTLLELVLFFIYCMH